MKNKFQKVIEMLKVLGLVVVIAVVISFTFTFLFVGLNNKEHEKLLEPKKGVVTVYDESKKVYFQYAGEMKIVVDGDNAEVTIELPSTGDSCFDAEGNLLP